MSRRDRRSVQPRVLDQLEVRWLLAAARIPGNVGQVLSSQFQPFGFPTTVGTQLRHVTLRGPLRINVADTAPLAGQGLGLPTIPINSGLVRHSQFNGGGFHTVGVQFNRVKLGGGLTISGFDNENQSATPIVATDPTATGGIATSGTTAPAFINRGLVDHSQFNDRGFGIVYRKPNGKLSVLEGRVGLQWSNTHVRGSVNVGLGVDVIQPGATTATPEIASASHGVSSAAVGNSNPGQTVIDFTTNIGRIKNSQFNDGGFGDVGMQWSGVAVGGHVGTSSNTLFITPRQDNYPPITVTNRVFGQGPAGASAPSVASVRASAAAGARGPAANSVVPAARGATHAAAAPLPFLTTYTNSATNSGRLVGAQFDDGGFGDVGLQWRKVGVGGSVTAVHNSLTVQPANNGQGLITVQGVQFPTAPSAPQPAAGPVHKLPAIPPVVVRDGEPVAARLPTPTGPLSPFFTVPFGGAGTVTLPFPGNLPLVNSATNSGLVKGGQFSAGGFGDQGLQWQNVHVGGNVQVVHNSLSVHPEGSKLAGISVSDVSYGPPVSQAVARNLAVLPFAVLSFEAPTAAGTPPVNPGPVLSPPNDRILTNQQLAAAGSTDVFLQWNGIVRRGGLVLVHNIIKVSGVGPTTGPITLSNIRFPFLVPNLGPLKLQALQPTITARAHSADPVLLNATNNSGIIDHAQFSDGGSGDDLLQWRHVRVGGSVTVVHNTLAVDETADPSPGPGPISVSNVTFNSGALEGVSRPKDQVLVSPPDIFQRLSTHPSSPGLPLPHDPAVIDESTNSGILRGGQLAAGGANHVLLQWQHVKVRGKVTVMDNVLSISVLDRPSGPITISNVTFA